LDRFVEILGYLRFVEGKGSSTGLVSGKRGIRAFDVRSLFICSADRFPNFAYSDLAAMRMGDIGIGIFPEGEDVPIRHSGFSIVALQHGGECETVTGERAEEWGSYGNGMR